MKNTGKIFAALVSAVLMSVCIVSGKDRMDSDGHELVSLWKEYDALKRQDRPDKEQCVLEKIISLSEKRHISWDFYDAWRQYRDAVLSADWKRKAEIDTAIFRSVKKFGDPVVSCTLMLEESSSENDSIALFIEKNADRLKSGRNHRFYGRVFDRFQGSFHAGLPSFVRDNISDDYEYALWALLFRSKESCGRVETLLSDYIDGSYPNGAYLEAYLASLNEDPVESLGGVAVKHAGKAVSLFAVQYILQERFAELLRDRDAESSDFRELRRDCVDFEKKRKGFSGSEKAIADDCTDVAQILETLDGKMIRIEGEEDTLNVLLRNIPDFEIEVRPEGRDKSVYSGKFKNGTGSYFTFDTVRVALPEMDDWRYIVRCVSGKTIAESLYEKYSVSVAYRLGDKWIAVYAADRKTGRPLDGADLDIFRGDSLVCAYNGLKFNGFVPVDCGTVCSSVDYHGYNMVCSYKDGKGFNRSSGTVHVGFQRCSGQQSDENAECMLLLDRAVFETGDTVSFKAVLFGRDVAGNSATGMSVLPFRENVKVYLNDAGRQKIDSLSLKTNDFGSVAGSFRIPSCERNGRFSIDVYYEGRLLDSEYFLSGEFELPSYSLVFEPSDSVYMPGDSIVVNGIVKSYSGHPLSSVSLHWNVSRMDKTVCEGVGTPEPDGRFSFRFADVVSSALMTSWYEITVKIIDATGETLEFRDSRTVSPGFSLSAVLENAAEGLVTPSEPYRYEPMNGYDTAVMDGDTARVLFTVRNNDWNEVQYPAVDYSVYFGNEVLYAGQALSGQPVDFDFSDRPSGVYRVESRSAMPLRVPGVADTLIVCRHTFDLVKTDNDDDAIDVDVENLFKVIDGDCVALQVGTTLGDMWAVVELWGGEGLLLSDLVHLDGQRGKPGSLSVLRYEYKDDYPDDTRLNVFYFRNGKDYSYSAEYHRNRASSVLPLEFYSFTDSALPLSRVSFTLKTLPCSECAVSVFDKSTEQLMSNLWNVTGFRNVPHVNVFACNGYSGCRGIMVKSARFEDNAVNRMAGMGYMHSDMALEEGSVLYGGSQEALIRDDFSNTLAFLPFLRSGSDSLVSFSFNTSGKLSAYNVSVFAHDRSVRNSVIRQDMTVTKPVMVSLSEPQFLHEGDRYDMKAVVSNNSGSDVSGILRLYVYDNEDYSSSEPLLVMEKDTVMPAAGTASVTFGIDVPERVEMLGFKLVFSAGPWSDGLFVSVPVRPEYQILTESHSAVLMPDMDVDALKDTLAGEFVNTSAYGAEMHRVSLLDLIKYAIPQKSEAVRNDAVSLSDALYVRVLSGCIPGTPAVDTLVTEILKCRNADGGFGWFPGMKSSGTVTALLLERVAGIRERTHDYAISENALCEALEYLDREVVGKVMKPVSVSGVSLSQYLYVRSMFPSVPVLMPVEKKLAADFRKSVKEYMTAPTGSECFGGRLIDKARRASVALNMLDDQAFADGFGFGRGTLRRISRILDSDMASLCSYAVRHPSGGMYYPNAVMPFKGLLESELYAHSLICDLMQRYSDAVEGLGSVSDDAVAEKADGIADALRLWMMIQKESRQWDDEPAFVRAVASVLDASDDVLETEIVVLSKSYAKPVSEIKASGNGFEVSQRVSRIVSPDNGHEVFVELHRGDTLDVGDKIVCRYCIWSEENRSLVRLSVPHCASFRPADQVSGMTGWWLRSPFLSKGTAVPQGYRNVTKDRTEYYFDAFPEGNTVIDEVFFVTQSGEFGASVPEIISEYAPHYRANDDFFGKILAE